MFLGSVCSVWFMVGELYIGVVGVCGVMCGLGEIVIVINFVERWLIRIVGLLVMLFLNFVCNDVMDCLF